MSGQTAVNPRKTPQQKRSQVLFDALLDSAARILVSEGFDRMTTNHVAEKAGVSIGSLYQYFPNKLALISELGHREKQRLVELINCHAVRTNLPFAVTVRGLLGAYVAFLEENKELHGELSRHFPKRNELGWNQTLDPVVDAGLCNLVEGHPATTGRHDTATVLFIVRSAVESIAHKAIQTRPEFLMAGRLEDELARLVCGYLCPEELGEDGVRV